MYQTLIISLSFIIMDEWSEKKWNPVHRGLVDVELAAWPLLGHRTFVSLNKSVWATGTAMSQ